MRSPYRRLPFIKRPLTPLLEYCAKDLEGGINRGHAAVSGTLEKYLCQLLGITANVQCCIAMQLQFINGPRRSQDGAGDHLAILERQHGPGIEVAGNEQGEIVCQLLVKLLP